MKSIIKYKILYQNTEFCRVALHISFHSGGAVQICSGYGTAVLPHKLLPACKLTYVELDLVCFPGVGLPSEDKRGIFIVLCGFLVSILYHETVYE